MRVLPFSESADLQAYGCSGALQGAISDFGTDITFQKVAGKLQEHYGLVVPVSAIRQITERYEAEIAKQQPRALRQAVDIVIAQNSDEVADLGKCL
ncbi:MAG: hypothetical protein AAGF04_00120 [Chlamydiota bacterium]